MLRFALIWLKNMFLCDKIKKYFCTDWNLYEKTDVCITAKIGQKRLYF